MKTLNPIKKTRRISAVNYIKKRGKPFLSDKVTAFLKISLAEKGK